MPRLVVLSLAVLVAGCDLVSNAAKKVDLPKPPKVDVSLLPVVDGAQRLLMDVAPARIEIDPTTSDAITALGACADLVTYCYAPGTHSVEECMANVPTCATQEPWNESDACCPKACQDDFAKAVKKGEAPIDAFERVVLTDSTCFPGVAAALENP